MEEREQQAYILNVVKNNRQGLAFDVCFVQSYHVEFWFTGLGLNNSVMLTRHTTFFAYEQYILIVQILDCDRASSDLSKIKIAVPNLCWKCFVKVAPNNHGRFRQFSFFIGYVGRIMYIMIINMGYNLLTNVYEEGHLYGVSGDSGGYAETIILVHSILTLRLTLRLIVSELVIEPILNMHLVALPLAGPRGKFGLGGQGENISYAENSLVYRSDGEVNGVKLAEKGGKDESDVGTMARKHAQVWTNDDIEDLAHYAS
ncbi:hypothetical protein ACJX0J_037664 [Zea mays]